MEPSVRHRQLRIGGMTCISCQNKIVQRLRDTAGIRCAEVSYSKGTAEIDYDTDLVTLKTIYSIIEELDYEVLSGGSRETQSSRGLGLVLIIAAIYLLLERSGLLNLLAPSQLADARMGYGMLFIIGLVTSVHCVAMCGGITLSQCIPRPADTTGEAAPLSTLRPALLYNLGRVVSYTAMGFLVGGLGSAITFSNTMQGVLKLGAGVFMVIMGLNMLNIFPWLRRLNPRLPAFLRRRIGTGRAKSNSPLVVGLLNGLMPCGPLQAMQIYALSTGSPWAGALSMLLFSLGTVPLMFGLGALSSVLGKRFTGRAMAAGAILVVVLGLSMLTQGWSLSGLSLPGQGSGSPTAQTGGSAVTVTIENGMQVVRSTLSRGRYPAITVQAGIPVRWVINAPQGTINGCNNRIFIPNYQIEYSFQSGENIVEFTPTETGVFPYSCWMGMIRSSITVVEAGAEIPNTAEGGEGPDGGLVFADTPADPIPADYRIPTGELAVAAPGKEYHEVTITLTDEGFQPAVLVVERNVQTLWRIKNTSATPDNSALLVPFYQTGIYLTQEETQLYVLPTDDFDFSNGESTLFGYVKVVDSLKDADLDAIRAEVGAYQAMIWPPETYGAGGAACH